MLCPMIDSDDLLRKLFNVSAFTVKSSNGEHHYFRNHVFAVGQLEYDRNPKRRSIKELVMKKQIDGARLVDGGKRTTDGGR